MPIVIPAGFANVAIKMVHEADPDPWYVTFGVNHDSSTTGFEEIGLTVTKAAFFGFGSNLSNQVEILGAEITLGQDDADPIRRFVPTVEELSGESAAEKLPQNCAALVKKSTLLGGRRNQGRFFLPGVLNKSDVSPTGMINTTHRQSLQNSLGDFLSKLDLPVADGLSCPMVLLHGTEGAGSTAPTPVVALTVDGTISTQRRRLR